MELGCEYALTVKNTQEKAGCCQGVTYCPTHVPGLGWFKCGSRWKFSYTFTIMDESSHGTFFTRGRGFGWEVWEGLAWPESITSFKSQPGRSFHIPHTIAPRIKPLFTFFWQAPDTPEKQVLNNIDNLFDQIWAAAGQLLWCKTKTSQNPFADFST